jgi:transcriptional regulator with XRE-family HTH domain
MGQQRKTLTPERSAQDRWRWELRTRRDNAGLSLAALGTLARFDRSYLARIERGDQFPSENAARACDQVLSADGELIRQWREADQERSRRPPVAAVVTAAEPASAQELPPFSGHAGCPKCAGGTVAVIYHAAPAGGFPCEAPARPVPGEHLCRACGQCGYGWCEAAADARPADRPALRLVKEAPDDGQHRPAGPGAAACT